MLCVCVCVLDCVCALDCGCECVCESMVERERGGICCV
jgi:hypothetical protein